MKFLAIVAFAICAADQVAGQGYIVPNGVALTGFYPGAGYDIEVVQDPVNYANYTGFLLNPTAAPNTFKFDPIVDEGVRVFFAGANAALSLQAILSGSFTELIGPNSYVFSSGTPFYVGLYTGNQNFAPPDGIYSDPLFGWARLVNVNGTIQLLDSALEYGGGGIYVGTQTIIPVPEPRMLALVATGALALGCHRGRRTRQQEKNYRAEK